MIRQGLLFVAVSGGGWLLDLLVFVTLSGPAGWPPVVANMASGSCGALFVFAMSARGIFARNHGSMAQKIAMLLVFNLAVIVVCSFILGWIVDELTIVVAAAQVFVPPVAIRIAAKMLVTPVTLVLNFVVVRFLLERFVGLAPASVAR